MLEIGAIVYYRHRITTYFELWHTAVKGLGLAYLLEHKYGVGMAPTWQMTLRRSRH